MTPFILKGIKGEIIALNRLDGPLFPHSVYADWVDGELWAAVWAEPAFHLLVPPAQLSPILLCLIPFFSYGLIPFPYRFIKFFLLLWISGEYFRIIFHILLIHAVT